MKWEDDLDAIIREALQGEEKPNAHFTEKVMEQVARTPQKRAVPRKKVIVSLAACAAVLVVVLPILRLSTLSMGKSAADCEAAECVTDECVSEDSAAAEDAPTEAPAAPTANESLTMFNGSADDSVSYDSGEDKSKVISGMQKSLKATSRAMVMIDPAMCAEVRTWLEENGFPPVEEQQQIEFDLTAEQASALHEAFPDLALPDVACTIRLEG